MFKSISSLIFMLILSFTSYFNIPMYGYESKQLLNDSDFSDGFSILSQQTVNNSSEKLGDFVYQSGSSVPYWMIAQWNSGPCLWQDRVDSNEFTITDGFTKTVTYDPVDKSVLMRLNAANIYNGEPADYSVWPHLLLEQSPIADYSQLSEVDKAFYNCSADRIVLELDIRIKDFVETTNTDGVNAVQYLAYFYMSGVNDDKFIWFGVNLFDNRGYQDTYWAPDSVGGLMIYTLSTRDTFGSNIGSLYRNGKPYVSDEWVHIEIDLSPHIAKAIQNANKSKTFGSDVAVDDFYISGTNIGFEIHGNYDCTVEIKDFKLTSYNRK